VNPFQQVLFASALQSKPFLQPLVDRLLSVGGSIACVWNDDETTSKETASRKNKTFVWF
jgi:hypothetical protein